MGQHSWDEKDDLLAFCLLRLRLKGSKIAIKEFAHIIGCSEGSLVKRIENFEFLNGVGKMSNYSKQTEDIFNKFNGVI